MTETEGTLKTNLDTYIKEHHTQEECIGFIDGYNKATEQLNLLFVSKRSELLIAFKAYQNGRAGKPNENDVYYVNSYSDWEKSNL